MRGYSRFFDARYLSINSSNFCVGFLSSSSTAFTNISQSFLEKAIVTFRFFLPRKVMSNSIGIIRQLYIQAVYLTIRIFIRIFIRITNLFYKEVIQRCHPYMHIGRKSQK